MATVDLVAKTNLRLNRVKAQIVEKPLPYYMFLIPTWLAAEYAQLWTGHSAMLGLGQIDVNATRKTHEML